jgi:hypothetical protein
MLAALLAGVSFGIWIGFNPDNLSALTYTEQQQHTIRSLSAVMTSLVVTALVITILSAFLQRKNKTVFIGLLIASMFFIACILISVFGNRPINNTVLTWTSDTIPADWKIFRDKWWSLHIARTITELIGLALVAWTSVRKTSV